MDYQEALKYLLGQLPMFQKSGGTAYREGLENITQLCHIIGNPQKDLRIIHIAGTNGKGSVSHIIASILQEQGYKTGLFVSPHYRDYRERIKIDGKYISKSFITNFIAEYATRFKAVDASFFEISNAMAFAYFKTKKVDFAIIETGMGGLNDSTNIVTPMLSVITNISLEHRQFLGNTLKQIARHKAGIIKPYVPVIIGERQIETDQVFIAAAKKNKSKIAFASALKIKSNYKTYLGAPYQQKNIKTAIAAIAELRRLNIEISENSINSGLKHVIRNTNFTGRWMIMNKKPLVIFDSAHNIAGLKELKKGIAAIKYGQLYFVLGTVSDKDLKANLSVLPKNALYYFCNPNLPRALPANDLKQNAVKFKLKGDAYPSVKKALKEALKNAGKNDLVITAGSIFVVGEVLHYKF